MSENRTGQWFVRARFPERWYGPVNDDHIGDDGQHRFKRSYIGQSGWLREKWITDGDYLRIPPHPDLQPGLTTRECRLPKKGERYVDLYGNIYFADHDWVAGTIDDFGWRRWIIEDESESEAEAKQPKRRGRSKTMSEQDENQNFAAKYREAQKEIDRLTRERDEARAACEALRQFIEYYADDRIPPDQLTRCPETVLGGLRFNAGVILANPSPGQPLLADNARLNKLVTDLTRERDEAHVSLRRRTRLTDWRARTVN